MYSAMQMKKLLKPKDVLLLALAGILDFHQELKDPFGLMEAGAKEIYGWVPKRYNKRNYYRVVRRGLNTGELERVIKNGEAYIRLTSRGKDKVKRDFAFRHLTSRWDRKWRVVIFDIAEINRSSRNALRRKLKDLGFGLLQKSVWVSPHDVIFDFREFVISRGLADSVYATEFTELSAGDPKNLAERIWRLSRLNEKYQSLLNEISSSLAENEGGLPKKSEEIRDIRSRYLQLLLEDPHLPKELLSNDWVGDRLRIRLESLPAL